MRSTLSILRLCPRLSASSTTPFRRIHQNHRLLRVPQSALCQQQARSSPICRHAFSTTAIRLEEKIPQSEGITSPSSPNKTAKPSSSATSGREEVPAYQMTFTCKVCSSRSAHKISKQGYHHGTVLISCPGCKNRHLISDHLKIFSDHSLTLEDIMRQNGELVKSGSLSEDGDLELWDDGTQTRREDSLQPTSRATNASQDDAAPGSSFKSGS